MADASGQQSLRSLLHTMVASLVIDGEILVREHWEDGYQLMVIDTGMLRAQETLPLEDGKFVRMGVEMDEMRRPVAYWITDAPLRNIVSGYTTQARGYPAERIIHAYEHTMPMQTRGVPWAFATLRRFQEIREYDESERKAAKLASNMYANYEPPAMDPLAGNLGLAAVPGAEPAGGRPPTPGAGPDTDGKTAVGVRDDGPGVMPGTMEPGTIFPVQPGGKLNLHSPEHPNTAYPDYIRANYQAAASAMGISYAAMTGDLSQANFVSSRMGRLAERGTIEMVQNMVIEKVLMRAYRKWLLDMSLRGMLPAGSLEELEMVEFVPPVMEHVQPREVAAANHQMIEDGVVSRSEIIRMRGRDPQTVFMEIEQEAAMFEPEPAPEPEPAGEEAPPPEGESGLGDKQTRDEVRRLAAEGASQSELGRRYGVTRQAIAKLLAGHTHKMDARTP